MSKQKIPPVPPTVLVITLNADGSGSLLARRGDLAHLSQFTYSGLTEIMAAMQNGAAALIEIEVNPPALETVSAVPAAEPATPDDVEPKSIESTETEGD